MYYAQEDEGGVYSFTARGEYSDLCPLDTAAVQQEKTKNGGNNSV